MAKKPKNNSIALISKNLRQVLKERGISARQGAVLADVPVSSFSAWAAGSSLPMDFLALRRFARSTGVSFAWLLTGEPDEPGATGVGRLEDMIEVANTEPVLSGVFLIEARKVKLKNPTGKE